MAVDTLLTHKKNSELFWIESESIRIIMQTRPGTIGLAVFNLSSHRFLASQFINILQRSRWCSNA